MPRSLGPLLRRASGRRHRFASADYIPASSLPWQDGTEAKRWLGINWFPTAAVDDADSGTTKNAFIYHEDTGATVTVSNNSLDAAGSVGLGPLVNPLTRMFGKNSLEIATEALATVLADHGL